MQSGQFIYILSILYIIFIIFIFIYIFIYLSCKEKTIINCYYFLYIFFWNLKFNLIIYEH